MNLYLVRHGLSTWNVAHRLQGWSDTELMPEGVAQAERTAEFFVDFRARWGWPFCAVYASPLHRTWHTATIIAQALALTPIAVPDLREMHGGVVEGLTLAEWQARYPELVPAWQDRTNLDFGWPGGETRRGFRARCVRAISAILARQAPLDNVIVVTHGGVIRAYLSGAGLDDPGGPRAYHAENCSITQVQFNADPPMDDGGQAWSVGCLLAFNEVGHLDGDLEPAAAIPNADLALQ